MSITGEPGRRADEGRRRPGRRAHRQDAAIGILAALRSARPYRRRPAGRGQPAVQPARRRWSTRRSATWPPARSRAGMGNRHPCIAPYETLRCADGPLARRLSATTAQFRRAAPRPWAARTWPTTRGSRPTPPGSRTATSSSTALEAAARPADRSTGWTCCTAAGVPCGRVNDIGEALAYADRLGLDAGARRRRRPPAPQVGNPISLSATPPRGYPAPPPDLGEHTDEVARLARTAAPTQPSATATDRKRSSHDAATRADRSTRLIPLGIDALLTEDEIAVRDTVRRFCADRVDPHVADWFERGELADAGSSPRSWARSALLGMHLEGYGCAGMSAVELRPGLPGTGGRATPASAPWSRSRDRWRCSRSGGSAQRGAEAATGCPAWPPARRSAASA